MDSEFGRAISEYFSDPGVIFGLIVVGATALWLGPKFLSEIKTGRHMKKVADKAVSSRFLTLSDVARLSGTTPQDVLKNGRKFRNDELYAMTYWKIEENNILSKQAPPMRYSDKPDKRVRSKNELG